MNLKSSFKFGVLMISLFFMTFMMVSLVSAAKSSKVAATQIEIILDASATMGDQMDSKTKMDAAKSTLVQIVDQLKSNKTVFVGLRIYGHTDESCENSVLEIPIQKTDADKIKKKILETNPNGLTPIAYSLLQSTNDFDPNVSGEKVVILVTDGVETCGGDPCSAAIALNKRGIKIHVVGLGMSDSDLNALKCIITPSSGIIVGADNSQELVSGMGKIIKKAIKAKASF